MKAKQFDKKFESGEDLTDNLAFSKARRVNQELKRVSIDFPTNHKGSYCILAMLLSGWSHARMIKVVATGAIG